MTDTSIQAFQPDSGALSAESYHTFELAKENDTVLGGDNIAQIRSYAAYARAQAQAIHKTIAATSGIEDVAAIKNEATETAQTFAKVGIYADQRIGEILRELPKAKNQHDVSDLPTGKTQAIKDAGFTPKTAAQLEQLAANPEVVQAVLDKAEADGTIPSRSQVLKAIRERNEAREEAKQYVSDLEDAQREIRALEKQNDELYELANNQQVVEREVVRTVAPEDYEDMKKRVRELEGSNRLYADDNESLRKQLADAQDGAFDHERLMDAARLEADMYRRKYSELKELAGVIAAIDQFLSE